MGYEPDARSTREVLRDWAAIMRALRRREIIRTNNNPIGDIAEAIVHQHYGGERGSFSQAGWDVKTPDGVRLQVKASRRTGSGKRRNHFAIIPKHVAQWRDRWDLLGTFLSMLRLSRFGG